MKRSLPPSVFFGFIAVALLALVALLSPGGGSGRRSLSEVSSPLANKPAPSIEANSTDGTPIRLEGLHGKVVLLNFWATWCGPCKVELPDFVALHKSYKDKGLALLGGVMNDDLDKAVAYAKANEMDWPQFAVTREIAEAYGGISAVPTTVLIDKEGTVQAVYVGAITRDDIEGKIKSLL